MLKKFYFVSCTGDISSEQLHPDVFRFKDNPDAFMFKYDAQREAAKRIKALILELEKKLEKLC